MGFIARVTSTRAGLLGAVSMLVLAQTVSGFAARNGNATSEDAS